MYQLFETIAIIDGLPQNLKWHQERLDNSYDQFFGGSEKPKLEKLLAVPEEFQKGLVKCRFIYGASSHSIKFSFYQPKIIETLKIIHENTISYSVKHTDRSAFNALLQRKGDCDEILIVKNNFVSDTSYTNIVFYDGNRWVTPSTPLLKGSCRSRLLYENRIFETEITKNDLKGYSTFKLINAMMDIDSAKELPISNIIDEQ